MGLFTRLRFRLQLQGPSPLIIMLDFSIQRGMMPMIIGDSPMKLWWLHTAKRWRCALFHHFHGIAIYNVSPWISASKVPGFPAGFHLLGGGGVEGLWGGGSSLGVGGSGWIKIKSVKIWGGSNWFFFWGGGSLPPKWACRKPWVRIDYIL